MKRINIQRFVHIFWLLVLIDLLAVLFGFSWLRWITKPSLMPALLLLLVYSCAKAPGKKLVLTALLFSWLGDVFLLFESRHVIFFIPGLVSFLMTHVCYVIYFLSIKSAAPSLLIKQPVHILLVVCYGTGLVLFLSPYLGDLKIPVILYSLVICSMLLCSIHIYLKVNEPANRYFVSGAILFVLSDTILAINKFYQPLPLAGIWLMLSYCAAQYFIVSGFISKKNSEI